MDYESGEFMEGDEVPGEGWSDSKVEWLVRVCRRETSWFQTRFDNEKNDQLRLKMIDNSGRGIVTTDQEWVFW